MLKYFKLDLLGEQPPALHPLWMDDWKYFLYELQTNFGPHDLMADVEAQLKRLQICNSQRITKYIIEWNHLASQVQDWGHRALCRSFYNRLSDQIKDEISHQDKPDNIMNLCALFQQINHRYWEHKEEILHASKCFGLNSRNQNNSSLKSSGSNTNNNSSLSSKPRDNKSKGSSSSTSTSDSSSNRGNNNNNKKGNSSTPDSNSFKLGKDNKLLPEECQ